MTKAASPESDLPDNPPDERLNRLRRQLERVERLLIIRLRSMGDSILALPLLEAFHQWRPEMQIDVLVQTPYGCLFDRHPAVHEVLSVRPRGGFAEDAWSRGRACFEIRKRRYSAVVNLHGGSTSMVFTVTSGAAIRIGQQKYRHAWAYNVRIPDPRAVWQRQELHTVEDQLTLLRWLGLPIPDRPRGMLHLDDAARVRIRERLAATGVPQTGYILIHPTATLRSKQWPEAKYAELADRLHKLYDLPVIISSGPREGQILLDIGRCAKEAHRYWSDLGLNDLLALIEGCRLFIGNDSGPTHAAAALGRSLVVVWGSSDFPVWHPWETEYEVVRLALPCTPCPGHTCAAFGVPKCIEEIPVDQVFAACRRFLGSEHKQKE